MREQGSLVPGRLRAAFGGALEILYFDIRLGVPDGFDGGADQDLVAGNDRLVGGTPTSGRIALRE